MVTIFAFDDVADASHPTNQNHRAAVLEKEWPRLGGGKSSATLKPASGLKALPQISILEGNSLPGLPGPLAHTTAASGTAKGGLAMLLAASRPSSRAPSDAGDIVAERAAEALQAQRGRKKKSKSKKGANRGAGVSTAALERPDFLLPRTLKSSPSTASLAAKFAVPEGVSADLEYTWSSKKQDQGSSASSMCSSPPRSGMPSLLNQAHPGDVVSVDVSGSESGEEPLVAYEVAIDEDYISKDVDSRSTSRTASPSRKKMTADDFEPLKCLGKGA